MGRQVVVMNLYVSVSASSKPPAASDVTVFHSPSRKAQQEIDIPSSLIEM